MDMLTLRKTLLVASAMVTGIIALSAYAGVVGLAGGGLSLGDTLKARIPFGSLLLAGLALLVIVAAPMTVAGVSAVKDTRHSPDVVFGAGLLLVVWIGVQLAFIQTYSWFHPTYLAAAVVVLALGWLLGRLSPAARIPQPSRRNNRAEAGPTRSLSGRTRPQ